MEYEPPTPFESLTGDTETIEKRKKKKRDSSLPWLPKLLEDEKDKTSDGKPAKEETPEVIKDNRHDKDEKPGHKDEEEADEPLEDLAATETESDEAAAEMVPESPEQTLEADEDEEEISAYVTPPVATPTPRRTPPTTRPSPPPVTPPPPPPTASGAGAAPPPPPGRPPTPPVGGRGTAGGGGGVPLGPTTPNVLPPTPNIAPNVLNNSNVVIDSRAENLGFFAVGLVLGLGIEHIRHKRREKRQQREWKKTEKFHREEKVALRSELGEQQLKSRRFETELDKLYRHSQPELAPVAATQLEKQLETAPNFAQELEPELPVKVELRKETLPELQPVAAETSAEYGRIERRDTTPEALMGERGSQTGAGAGTPVRPDQAPVTTPDRRTPEIKTSPFQPLGLPSRRAQQTRPLIITSAIAFVVAVGFLIWLLLR